MSLHPLKALEAQLGYCFVNIGLLKQALTHRSFSVSHNERLEFLGDSVLNCAASILLYQEFAQFDEGRLSRIRSHLVKQDCLAMIGRKIGIDQVLILGSGELKKREQIKDSIVADALEAIFGAILLDSHFEKACACVLHLLRPVLADTPIESLGKDPKTRLQEWLQSNRKKLPIYSVLVEGGTTQSPEFKVECSVLEFNIQKIGVGLSRRMAEQQAAQDVLEILQTQH